LSGIWDNGRNTGGGRGGAATLGLPGTAAPAPTANAGPPNATFFNVGAGFRELIEFICQERDAAHYVGATAR
jgi:hypothetical protein